MLIFNKGNVERDYIVETFIVINKKYRVLYSKEYNVRVMVLYSK